MKTLEEKRAYYRAHYQANKEKYRARRTRYELRLRAIVLEAKDQLCMDCGGRWHPLIMDLHHRDGEVKRFNLGDWRRLRCVGEAGLRREIAKCDVLCPTCHRIRTFQKRGLL